MLKTILVMLFLFTLNLALAGDPSNPVDVINGSCTNWNPGFDSSCQTCLKKVCPGNAKTCKKSEMKCVGMKDCNEWARGVCGSWKNWCKKYVINAPKKGEQMTSQFAPYVQKCRLYERGSILFRTYLTDVTPESNTNVTPDPGNTLGKGPGGEPHHVSGTSGTVSEEPGYGSFGEFCERSKEWCETPSIENEISDQVARKELKKFIYEKGAERIIEGMKKFEGDIAMGGSPADRPSERMLDLACCNEMKSCLTETSYGEGNLALDTGNQDWAPSFCKGRTLSCEKASQSASAASGMDVKNLSEKLSTFANSLKTHANAMINVYAKLPLSDRMISTSACSEPLKPSQAKIGNPECQTKFLTLAETAAKIRSQKNPTAESQAFMESFDQFTARHRLLGTSPYVLLLTKDLKKTFSGKNMKDIGTLKTAAANMNFDSNAVKKALGDFSGEVASKAMCSLKRLYSGRVKGNEDLNGLEDCTAGSDENRAILSSIQKNPGLFEEVVQTGKGLPSTLNLQQVDRIACGIQRQTKSCEEMWESWAPYTKTLKTSMSLAKYPLTVFAPYIAVPYFYADAAIELADTASELDKAHIREEQILSSVLKNEMADEEFMVELDDREEKLTKAKIEMIIAIAGTAGDVKEVGEHVYIKLLGPEAGKLTLLNLIDQGDEMAVKNYLKKNPKVKVQVSNKPFKKNKKS